MLYNVKAGIIGLEDLGSKVASLINDHVKNLNLIAAYGRSQKELLYAKNDLSLEYVYSDEKALIENHDVDALFILSDPRFRADQAIQAIDKGKHVFLMNPMALNYDDAHTVWKTADSHPSQTVMCASTVKSMPELNKIIELRDGNSLGSIEWIKVDDGFVQSMGKSYAMPSGSKYLDCILDEIELCRLLDDRNVEKVNVTDYKNSKVAHAISGGKEIWSFTIASKTDRPAGMLTVQFEKARISISSYNRNLISIYHHDGRVETITAQKPFEFQFPEYLQMHHFTNCILGKEKNMLKPNPALKAMQLALSFEKSDVLNTEIDLD